METEPMPKSSRLTSMMVFVSLGAVVALGGTLAFDLWTYATDKPILRSIDAELVTWLDLSLELKDTLDGVQSLLQDAAAEVDVEFLSEADSRRDAFLELLEHGRGHENLNREELQKLIESFSRYYTFARQVTLVLIEEGWTAETMRDMQKMVTAYRALSDSLDEFRSRRREDLTMAVQRILQNRKRALLIKFGLTCFAICILVGCIAVASRSRDSRAAPQKT